MPLVSMIWISSESWESNGYMEWFGMIELACGYIGMMKPCGKIP